MFLYHLMSDYLHLLKLTFWIGNCCSQLQCYPKVGLHISIWILGMQIILLKISVFISFASQWLAYLSIVSTSICVFFVFFFALSIIIYSIFLLLSYFPILVLFPK
jgi:hypothetical protein